VPNSRTPSNPVLETRLLEIAMYTQERLGVLQFTRRAFLAGVGASSAVAALRAMTRMCGVNIWHGSTAESSGTLWGSTATAKR
jgi:hypothetical protein